MVLSHTSCELPKVLPVRLPKVLPVTHPGGLIGSQPWAWITTPGAGDAQHHVLFELNLIKS